MRCIVHLYCTPVMMYKTSLKVTYFIHSEPSFRLFGHGSGSILDEHHHYSDNDCNYNQRYHNSKYYCERGIYQKQIRSN